MTDEPDQMPNPVAVMANRAALLQNLGNIFPISEVDRNNTVKLQSWYVLALDQVCDFLKASGASADIVLGFVYLTDAIGQLKNGTVASVVQRATPGNRGPDGLIVWSYRHDVVIGLECILRSGTRKIKGKDGAVEYIAKNYPAFHRLKRDAGKSLAASIVSWRRHFKEKNVPESEDFQQRQSEFFERHGDLPPAEMFELGKRHLALAAERTTKAVF